MRDLCGTCKNIKNFVACAVSRSFCGLAANHPEFLGCGLLALQSLVKSLKFETSCDLQEAGAGTRLNDSILFACHRISCNINLHTTIADHWHVEHLLASQILAHQLGFDLGSSGKGEHVL